MILDSVGGETLVDDIGALAYRGTLVSVGVAGRAVSKDRSERSMGAEQTLRGVFLGGALLTHIPASTR